jgi:mono/diheme cytochrome c family protein
MTRKFSMTLLAALLGATAMSTAQAYDADWKRGRVYYRQVCTSCHMAQVNKQFSPNEKAKADWANYLTANKHAKGKDTVSQYFSKQYRASIKASNKAAEKFADVPDQELIDDVKAFLMKGAKDGDSPASCS